MKPIDITLTLNGSPLSFTEDPTKRLSEVLRNRLNFKGTKVGCDAGDCGACSVLIDDQLACSCLVPIAQANESRIETVEGLNDNGTLSQLQQSFLHHGAAQCGVCTPGMLMSAKALLEVNPSPTTSEVEDALGGVLCRCTGYQKIIDAVVNTHSFKKIEQQPEAGRAIGASIQHLDGAPKVTGELAYGADEFPSDTLFIRIIRSPHHHAAFTIGDSQNFISSSDGLALFLSAADIPGRNCHGVIPPFADQPVFAVNTARFRGEAVAAVVGTAEALGALEENAIPIQWQELPYSVIPEEAVLDNSTLVHDTRAGNVLVEGFVERGDTNTALENASYSVTVQTSTPFIEHAYIEPEAGYCVRVGERIEIHGCTQAAQMDKESLADIMNLPLEAIRVMPSACGGGFGSKLDISFQPYIALAAWLLKRPVAINYTRGDSMQSTTKRHPSNITLTIGCDKEGMLSGFDFKGTFNTGAYASWGPTVANRVPVHASGPYHIPDYRARSVAVHTNTPPSGAFRGFGVPQSAVAQETAFDQLADTVGIDRLEFRLRNALRNQQPTVTGQVFNSGVGIAECLQALQATWKSANKKARAYNQSNRGQLVKGVGIGTCWYGCGNTSLPNPSTIRIGITPKGEVVLHQGAMDIGQGSNTVITQITADALGVPVNTITIIGGDTDLTPDCGKTSASRQTYVTGMAAKRSAEALRTALLRLGNVSTDAHVALSTGPTIELQDGQQTATIDLRQMDVNEFGYVLMSEETYDPPTSPLDSQGQGSPYAVYGYGAQLMELTVDTKLGTIKLDRVTAAHDVGRAINPMLVEGQIEGGIAQGIGMALMEEYIPGKTENLHDYLIPTIGDMPVFNNIIVEVEDAEGPYGAKGLGEHVLIPTAPAILNAIRDATGAIVSELPATPHKVLAAINRIRHE